MTNPNMYPQFTQAVPSQEVARDPSDFIPMARCKGRLMIVRPLKYQAEGFTTKHKPDGTDVVFCDIAVLDPIPPATDEYGEVIPGFPPGQQFRNQTVLQGYLKGTFKRYLGATLIGTMNLGPATKGKPPMMWQDLSGDPNCVMRGQQFFAAHPEFLIPVEATFSPATPEQPAGPPAYNPPPVSNPYQQSHPPAQSYATPAAAAQTPPVYQQDPWAQQNGSAAPVSPAPAAQSMNTLEQLKQFRETNHQGQPQSADAPF